MYNLPFPQEMPKQVQKKIKTREASLLDPELTHFNSERGPLPTSKVMSLVASDRSKYQITGSDVPFRAHCQDCLGLVHLFAPPHCTPLSNSTKLSSNLAGIGILMLCIASQPFLNNWGVNRVSWTAGPLYGAS